MATNVPPLPKALKALGPFMKRAREVEKFEPMVAYYTRCFVMERGMEMMRAHAKDHAEMGAMKGFLFGLMDALEEEKAAVAELLAEGLGQEYCTGFAMRVFKNADDEDRAGKASKTTARNYYAAMLFFEVCTQFGPLGDDLDKMQAYAKWKAADITKALREGRVPTAGDAREEGSSSTPAEGDAVQPAPPVVYDAVQPAPPVVYDAVPPPSAPAASAPPVVYDAVPPPSAPAASAPMFPSVAAVPPQPAASVPQQQQQRQQVQPVVYAAAPLQPAVYAAPAAAPPPQPQQQLSMKDILEAQRFAKVAYSALNFEDVPEAVKNLKLSLAKLGVHVP